MRLRPAVDELDDPAVARHRRLDGLQRRARSRPPASSTGGRSEDPASASIGRSAGRLAPQHPGRRVVGRGQAVEARPHRRLAEDEPDPRGRRRPAVGGRIVAQGSNPLGLASAEDRGRGPLPEAPEVLAEPRLDRARRSRPRDAGRTRARAGTRPRRRATGCARGTGSRLCGRTWPDETRKLRRRGPDRSPGGWPAGSRGAGPAGARRGPGPRAGPPRSARGSRRGPRAGAACAGRAARRGASRHRRRRGSVERSDGAHRLGPDVGRRAPQVVGVERRLALLRPAALVAADRAAVVPGDRSRPARDAGLVVDRPDELVGDEHPAARRAARREQVADRHLEARLAARRRGQPLERGVEVADVGRPQDDLGEHPGERARLERDRPALAVDGGPGDPPAAAEEVGDDVAGPGVELDPGGDDRRRRRGREAVEDGQRVPRLGDRRVRGRSRGRC